MTNIDYTWNRRLLTFSKRNLRLTSRPWFQGVLLLACVITAMLLANLPFTKDIYRGILDTSFQFHLISQGGGVDILFPRNMTIEGFINDILMVLFFFTVGIEIRSEIRDGELSSPKKAIMPVIAAFGGVIVPALIFTAVNHSTAAASGWGIPTATDIAFAICILSVLGDKVPVSLKVFLTALAVVDDLIAILVVAIFYGGSLNFILIGISVLVIAATVLIRKRGEKHMLPYIISAIAIWFLFYYAGIHATMSGVVMAFLIPAEPRYAKAKYFHRRNFLIGQLDRFEGAEEGKDFPNTQQAQILHDLRITAKRSIDMSSNIEHALSPVVNYIIMPLFALANAGVEISDLSYFKIFNYDPVIGSVGMGIFLGLVLGKPIGITFSCWLGSKFHIGEKPENTTWPITFAVACLGGIGFTMSIFVDTLSFADQTPELALHLRNAGKIAVLMGSICSGILGSILINLFAKIKKK